MKKINVTVWNEYFHERSSESVGKIYPEGIHSAIAGKLSAFENFNVRTATLDMPQHGLTDEVLDNTDVLIWWGHAKHGELLLDERNDTLEIRRFSENPKLYH